MLSPYLPKDFTPPLWDICLHTPAPFEQPGPTRTTVQKGFVSYRVDICCQKVRRTSWDSTCLLSGTESPAVGLSCPRLCLRVMDICGSSWVEDPLRTFCLFCLFSLLIIHSLAFCFITYLLLLFHFLHLFVFLLSGVSPSDVCSCEGRVCRCEGRVCRCVSHQTSISKCEICWD